MVVIRSAKIKDAKEIAKLNFKLMEEHEKFDKIYRIKKNSLEMMEQWHKKSPHDPRRKVFVAEDSGKIVGYAGVRIKKRPDIYKIEELGFIDEIYVEPEYRRQGISRRFLELIFDWLKKKGVLYADLFVAVKNETAQTVWKKFKFKAFLKEKYRKI